MNYKILSIIAGLVIFSACSTSKNTTEVSSANTDGMPSGKIEVATPVPQSAQRDEQQGVKPAFQEVRYDR